MVVGCSATSTTNSLRGLDIMRRLLGSNENNENRNLVRREWKFRLALCN